MKKTVKIFLFVLLFASVSYGYSVKQIKRLQTELMQLGFDPGVIDGKIGPNTKAAIKSFQKAVGEKPDARLTRHIYYKIHNAANSVTAGFSHEAEEKNGIKKSD